MMLRDADLITHPCVNCSAIRQKNLDGRNKHRIDRSSVSWTLWNNDDDTHSLVSCLLVERFTELAFTATATFIAAFSNRTAHLSTVLTLYKETKR